MLFLQRYSYLLLSLVLIAGSVGYAVWAGQDTFGVVGTLLVFTLLAGFWVGARRGAITPANPEKRVRRARGAGRPLVVHFFSDLSTGCLVKRVLAAGAEKEFRGRFELIYIDIGHREGKEAVAALSGSLGSFLIYDATGKHVETTGLISKAKLAEVLESAPQ